MHLLLSQTLNVFTYKQLIHSTLLPSWVHRLRNLINSLQIHLFIFTSLTCIFHYDNHKHP